MSTGLAGRTVLVTGGGSGIGEPLAAAYGTEGANVALTYHRDADRAEAAAALVRAAGGDAAAFAFDLAHPGGADTLVRAVHARWGRIDVLVCNAVQWPTPAPDGRFEDLDPTVWRTEIATNVDGNLAVVAAVLPHMRRAHWGRILFVSTGIAEEGMHGAEIYATVKAALHGFARSLAWGVGTDGILVNVLAAGLTLTVRNRGALPEHVTAGVASRVPLRRLSAPAELTGPALFLTSELNTSVTGELLREGSSTGRSSHAS